MLWVFLDLLSAYVAVDFLRVLEIEFLLLDLYLITFLH